MSPRPATSTSFYEASVNSTTAYTCYSGSDCNGACLAFMCEFAPNSKACGMSPYNYACNGGFPGTGGAAPAPCLVRRSVASIGLGTAATTAGSVYSNSTTVR